MKSSLKPRTKNHGLRLASGLIAGCFIAVFSLGNVLSESVKPSPAPLYQVAKINDVKPFIGTSFIEYDRPVTASMTIIWSADAVPGHRPAIVPRCNDPTA